MAFEISDEDVLNVVERVFKIRISFEFGYFPNVDQFDCHSCQIHQTYN